MIATTAFPRLGHGIGLRTAHTRAIRAGIAAGVRTGALADVDWFEIISENFFEPGGNPRRLLREVREHFPIVMHGVAMSLGSTDPLNEAHLARLAALVEEVQPALVSDHLCWSGVAGHHAHDLLPLPFTEEALAHVTARVTRVQEHLGRRILVENVSSYVEFTSSHVPEWEFLGALADKADCGILLDVNNVFVNAHNHGFDARKYLRSLPSARVAQIHLAGHSTRGPLLIDTHDHPVGPEVWDLYRLAVALHGPVSTLIEWDDRLPSLEGVVAEARTARRIAAEVTAADETSVRLAHG